MSKIECENVQVTNIDKLTVDELRLTFNTLCNRIESGLITNMDMSILTMSTTDRDITAASIMVSQQITDDNSLPPLITVSQIRAENVDRDYLFEAYNTLCETARMTMMHDDKNRGTLVVVGNAWDQAMAVIPHSHGQTFYKWGDEDVAVQSDDCD